MLVAKTKHYLDSFLKALPLIVALGLPAAAGAQECVGKNLSDALPADARADLDAATEATPFHSGLFWRATKGDAAITLIGTYHFDDPRHEATMSRFAPVLAKADSLFVEAGPVEEKRLMTALAADPTLSVQPDGQTLAERLAPAEWEALSEALSQRGVPAIAAARLKPWYVATLLGVSPCMLAQMAEGGGVNGLDRQLITAAEAADVPVHPLEPWDTVFTIFSELSPEDELDLIRASLPAAAHADDYAVTLTDAYFSGDIWQIWEFGRVDAYLNSGLPKAKVDQMMVDAQTALMDRRNESWIAPLDQAATTAATQDKEIVAAFGALHLPGEKGVLRLLEKDGWQVARLD